MTGTTAAGGAAAAARKVVIWTQLYEWRDCDCSCGEPCEGPAETGSSSDEYDLAADRPWFGADPVEFAVAVIEAEGCGLQPSCGPEWGGPHTWYSAEPCTCPRTGRIEEKSAHLRGFTESEAREIYRRITSR